MTNLRTPTFDAVQTAPFYEGALLNFEYIYPGESIRERNIRFTMNSVPVARAIDGAYVDHWQFLVPLRIIFDQWEQFILGDDSVSLPVAAAADADKRVLVKVGDITFPKLAMDHVFENFFTDPAMPSKVNPYDLPLVDGHTEVQMAADMQSEPPVEARFPVEGSSPNEYVDIDPTELRTAEYLERMRQRVARYTDPYRDFLSGFGVRSFDDLQLAEYLGGSRRWITPVRSVNPSNGLSTQSYGVDFDKAYRKPIYSREHAILLDIVAVRPKAFPNAHNKNVESLWTKPEHWLPIPDTMDSQIDVPANMIYQGQPDTRLHPKTPLFAGAFRVGHGLIAPSGGYTFVNKYAHSNANQFAYPPSFVTPKFEGGGHATFDGRIRSVIRTRLSRPPLVKVPVG